MGLGGHRWLGLTVLLAASTLIRPAIAQPAAAEAAKSTEQALYEVTFDNFGAYRQIGTAGPFYPERAYRFGIDGKAVIDCTVGPSSELTACMVRSEEPRGWGFGDAACKLAARRAIHPISHEGGVVPAAGQTIRLVVPFVLAPGNAHALPGEHGEPLEENYRNGVEAARHGDQAMAIRAFNESIKLRPAYVPAIFARGQVYYDEGQYDLAYRDLDKTIELRWTYRDANYAKAYYLRANIHAERGENDLAVADYDQAISWAPTLTEALVDEGVVYDAKGQFALAIKNYDRAIQIKPGVDAYRNRAVAHFHNGELALAVSDYDQALALKPDDASAYFGRAAARVSLGQYDDAIQDFDRAIANKSGFAVAFENRCLTRAIAGKSLDLALSDCNQAITLEPKSAGALGARSLVELRQNRYEQAIGDDNIVLAADPHSARALFVRGIARRRLGDTSKGDADILAAKAISPKIEETYATYGVTP